MPALSLSGETGRTVRQLFRYAVTGGAVTLGVAAGYWLLATWARIDPNLALAIVFVLFTGIGYVAHSRISFRGHGTRDRVHVRTARFLAVNLIGFALNQLFVWLLVKQMGGATWWPIPPIVFVTPIVTFSLHRRWVFG